MNNNYNGVIIEESLENKEVLKEVKILKTEVEPVTEEHKTPWLQQWTLHTVEIPEYKAQIIAEKISRTLDSEHMSSWYSDFKNNETHFIIFRDKIFHVNRENKEEHNEVVKYGVSLGIPAHQLDFSPDIREWLR